MHFLIEIGQHQVNITHYIFKNILIKKQQQQHLNKILFKESELSFTANRLKGIDFTLYSFSGIEYFIRSCWPLPEPCKHPLHHIHFNITQCAQSCSKLKMVISRLFIKPNSEGRYYIEFYYTF